MGMVSKELHDLLDAMSLRDVMEGNGYHHDPKQPSGTRGFYLSPHRAESKASFLVDWEPQGKLPDNACGFYDFGDKDNPVCQGIGAIQLQAYLFGITTKGNDYLHVMSKLMQIAGIVPDEGGVVGGEPHSAWLDPIAKDKEEADFAEFDVCEWSDALLRAIGCEVREVKDGEVMRKEYSWGKNFEPEMVSQMFHCHPISHFVSSNIPVKKGGMIRIELWSRNDIYPMFLFIYDCGDGTARAKKYEPNSYATDEQKKRNSKWTWWKIKMEGAATQPKSDKRVSQVIYGDTDTERALRTGEIIATDEEGHPVVDVTVEKDGEKTTVKKFKRLVLCSGPRDAMNVYFHSDAHVAFLFSEKGKLTKWDLRRFQQIAKEVYILYDADRTGIESMHKLAFAAPTVKVVYLPQEMRSVVDRRSGKPCKDVSEYFANWQFIVREMDHVWADATVNEHFDSLLRTARPMQWWVEGYGTTGKRGGGREVKEKYTLNVKNMTQFLSASGMKRGTDETGATDFIEMRGNLYKNVSSEGKEDEVLEKARSLMSGYLRRYPDYYTEVLDNAIYTAKGLSVNTLMALDKVQLNTCSWGEDFDYIFFRDRALKVTADKAESVSYDAVPYHINRAKILPYKFKEEQLYFRIIPHPSLPEREEKHNALLEACQNDDQRNAENHRWMAERDLWAYKLEVFKPFDEMPIFFRFLYNTGRYYWRKERHSPKLKLTATEKQLQDMSFIVKMLCWGYMIACHRDSAQQLMVLCTDYAQSDQSKSTGGNGKSMYAYALNLVRYCCLIPGQSFRTQTEIGKNFARFRPIIDSILNIEDLSARVQGQDFYNIIQALTIKRLYRDEQQIDARISPKIIATVNLFFDLSAQSTYRRVRTALFSDYYHAANHETGDGEFSPEIEFGKNIYTQATPDEVNTMINTLVYALELFLRYRTIPMTPVDKRFLLRSAARAIRDDALVSWAADFFDTRRTWHFGRPVLASDIYLSYLKHSGKEFTSANYNAAIAKMRKALPAICEILDIRMDPSVVFGSKSAEERSGERRPAWGTVTTDSGVPLEPRRREIIKGRAVHYFYHIEADPNNPDDRIPNSTEELLGPTETDMEDML